MERAIETTRSDDAWDEAIAEPDDSAARLMHAAGRAIHVVRSTTPEGHVVRIHPDGTEELIRVDLDEAARILGR